MKYYQVFGRESCPWCCKACEVLKMNGHNFMFCEMEHSPDLIQYHKNIHDMNTVPIVVQRDTSTGEKKLIGGCDDLIKYLESENEKNS